MAFSQNGGGFLLQTGDTKRVHGLSQALLTDANLQLVQEGVHHFFYLLRDIVAPKELNYKFSQKELITKINLMEDERWSRIRTEVLHSTFHHYSDGNFTREEDLTPVKVIFDLVTAMKDSKDLIQEKLQEYYNNEGSLRKEIQTLREKSLAAQQDLLDVQYNHNRDKATLTSVSSTITHLEEVITGKTDRITELQREGTVQLWQTEKNRVLAKADERIKNLEGEIENLKNDKEALNKKLMSVDGQFRMQKFKNEIETNSRPTVDASKELQKTKQYVYVLEKDLRSVEGELFTQQKYMIGILNGLKQDYWTTWDTVLTEESSAVAPEVFRQGRQLGLRLDKVWRAAADGKLGLLRADLPDHYLATDKDVNRVPIKKLSAAYGAKLAPLAEKKKPKKDPQTTEKEATSCQKEATSCHTSTVPPQEHPELVNPRTNMVNMITVMKHFHHMTKEYVSEQWEQFRRYDTNGDGDLDLTEMMSAMTTTVGVECFSAVQVRDAMMEVDIDGSNTIDFFEYLSIANMLQDKKGQSDVFRSKLVQEKGRHVSKTCVMQ